MTTKTHSSIGASSMSRWAACPGSVALSDGMPNVSSRYAAEGTCAHDMADACLKQNANADRFLGTKHVVEGFEFEVDDEMVDAVQLYLDTVRGDFNEDTGDILKSEVKFDLSSVYPGLFGTNDATVWKPAARKLIIYDFKYGAGIPVEVKRNKQLMYYALGASIALNLPAMTIELVIVQPRCFHPDGPVRRDVMNVMDLYDFKVDLAMAASATTKKDAKRVPGDHCRFCPAAGVCPEKANIASVAAAMVFDDAPKTAENPKGIDYVKLAEALKLVPIVKSWAEAVDSLAYTEAERGMTIPGYKLVDKRANRVWKDIPAAEQALKKRGLGETEMYPEPVLRSPAQIEKVVGKKEFAKIEADLVEKKSSGHALVPESDKRPAVTRESAADAFSGA